MMSVLHAIYKCMATLVPVLPDDLGKARDGGLVPWWTQPFDKSGAGKRIFRALQVPSRFVGRSCTRETRSFEAEWAALH
jgi:hypothetical protein